MKAANDNARERHRAMTATGKTLRILLLLITVATPAVQAAVTASVDRDRVSLGDSLRLVISSSDDEDISDLDARPLLDDFEILQRSSSSNTSIVNGRATRSRTITLEISPRREGTLRIPPLTAGGRQTPLILISVGPAPSLAAADETVLFEAEVDREQVYVQGQLVLTLRVQQAVNLDARSITELQLDDAFVKPLEQRSFQRSLNGRPWLVHEVRYAIFPEQSGTLEIPAQTFTARESQPRRSLFDLGSSGRPIRRSSEAISIEVLPRPAGFPGSTWLPARALTLEETWSVPPEQLQAGESATRTIRIRGEGLQGAQLPPILVPPVDGLKFYPDQPAIADVEDGNGLVGERVDSAALVPTRSGRWEIPEIRIPWWDTQSREVKYAVVPARTLEISAPAVAAGMPALAGDAGPIEITPLQAQPAAGGSAGLPWMLVAIISSAGWVLTLAALLVLLLRSSRKAGRAVDEARADTAGEAKLYKDLMAACAANQPREARRALIAWVARREENPGITTLAQAARALGGDDNALQAAIDELDTASYGNGAGDWHARSLQPLLQEARRKHRAGTPGSGATRLTLYPA